MRKIIVILALVVLAAAIFLLYNRPLSREDVISNLEAAIAQSVEAGEYRCCIEPACKMCYLGDWIFEEGKCACDDMIAQGQIDKVCPECVHGMEEGKCESSQDSCSVEI